MYDSQYISILDPSNHIISTAPHNLPPREQRQWGVIPFCIINNAEFCHTGMLLIQSPVGWLLVWRRQTWDFFIHALNISVWSAMAPQNPETSSPYLFAYVPPVLHAALRQWYCPVSSSLWILIHIIIHFMYTTGRFLPYYCSLRHNRRTHNTANNTGG